MKRIFDLILLLILLPVFSFFLAIISVLVKVTSKGPIIYWSDRIGKNNVIIKMPKFRTMSVGAPIVETEKLKNIEALLTPIGKFLRLSSLDEIPQFFSVLKGDMSFVGPRPALVSQHNLNDIRTKKGIDKILPGITGWAQVNGRDNVSDIEKALLDEEYLYKQSLLMDIKILLLTIFKVIKKDGVKH